MTSEFEEAWERYVTYWLTRLDNWTDDLMIRIGTPLLRYRWIGRLAGARYPVEPPSA